MPLVFKIGYYIGSRWFQIFCATALLAGGGMIVWGENKARRELESLQWPKVTGTMVQSEVARRVRSTGRRSSRIVYYAAITYTYKVDGERHVSHQIKLWNADLEDDSDIVQAFIAEHPAQSSVEVYYSPQHPEQAVLIPGADEVAHTVSRWGGIALLIVSSLGLIGSRKTFARVRKRHAEPEIEPVHVAGPARPFLTYEPANKRKLNCFPDKETLLDALGHEGQKIQDWEPDDRAIDYAGNVYRLEYREKEDRYDLSATGEKWGYLRLLEIAEGDFRFMKRNPGTLRLRVEEAPDGDRLRVLMQLLDELPAAPSWAVVTLIAFLILFGIGVFLAAGLLFQWVMARWPNDYHSMGLLFVVVIMLILTGIQRIDSAWSKKHHSTRRRNRR